MKRSDDKPFGSSWATVVATLAIQCACLSMMACEVPRPETLRPHGGESFDPTRFDAGTLPDGALPAKLTFGVTPFYSPERQRPMLAQLETYLTEKTGIVVETLVSETYEAAIDALARGDIDVAQLSPYAFVVAQERIPTLRSVATAVAQGSVSYASYLVVTRDSDIRSLADIRGTRLGFVDALSTSGALYPSAWLKKNGFDLEKDFILTFHGSHDQTYAALLAGEIDVAAVSSDTLVHAQAIGLSGPVRVVAKTGRVPYDAIVVRGELSPRAVELVRRAFLNLSIHDDKGRRVLDNYNLINGFMPIPKGHYDEVRAHAVASRAAKVPVSTTVPTP